MPQNLSKVKWAVNIRIVRIKVPEGLEGLPLDLNMNKGCFFERYDGPNLSGKIFILKNER